MRQTSGGQALNAEEMARAEQGRLVVSRVIRRLIPFIFLCYVVAYIDRVNIGFAANQLQRDLGLSDAAHAARAPDSSSSATVSSKSPAT